MKLPIRAQRLYITEFDENMAESVHLNSLDDNNRRFIPDEVFETADKARETIIELKGFYSRKDSPLVYPFFLNDGTHVGHVQVYPVKADWEIGYHIAKSYTGQGFATEAVGAFLIPVMKHLGIFTVYGICHAENIASIKVLEKNNFILDFEGEDFLHGKKQKICRYKYKLTML